MRKSSDALENRQRWAATDYRLAGSGVESDCKKQRCFPFRVIVFNYFSRVFPGIDDFSACTDDAVLSFRMISDTRIECRDANS